VLLEGASRILSTFKKCRLIVLALFDSIAAWSFVTG
jgi:hypothetical protein